MFAKLSKSIYQQARSNKYYYIIEILSEVQIQLSLFEINLLYKEKDKDFSIMTSVIQPVSLVINLKSPGLYDYFMDNYIMIWIINLILSVYLIIPLFILLSLIKIKYSIVPKFAYSWMSNFGYIHLYIISYTIHSWFVYQIQKLYFFNTENSIYAGFSLMLIIINIVISIFICKIYISQVYLPGFVGHKSRFSRWMNLIFKLAFPIFQAFESSIIRNILFLVLLAIWGFLRQVNLIFSNPYYNYRTIKMMSYLQGITCGIIISNLIGFLMQSKMENTSNMCGLLIFITSSFSSQCLMVIANKKVDELLYKKRKLNDVEYASQCCLIEQFTYNIHRKGIIRQNSNQDELISNGLLSSHQDNCKECHDKESLQFIRSHLLSTKIFEGLKIYKDSFILNCLALNFYLREKYDPYRSCFLLEKLKMTTLTIEDKLILKAYEVKIEEALCLDTDDNNIDYVRFADCENFYEQFLCSIKNATETYKKFWAEINLSMPDLLNLIKIAIQVHEDHKKFKKKLIIYQTYYMESFSKPLLLAGLYYDILRNSHDESFYMLQKYTKFMMHHSNTNIEDQITSNPFCSKDNVNMRISGSDDSLGNIVSCSGNIREITNFNAGKLIGRNISYIMPNLFRNYHNEFIRDYKETGHSNIINKSNFQFFKHEYGHIVPVNIHVSIYPIQEFNLTFLGIIGLIKTNYEYILMNQEGEIEGMTLGISQELNFKSDYKTNFCSLLYFNKQSPYRESNIEPIISPNSNGQSLAIIQLEFGSTMHLNERPTTNSINYKSGSQLFSRMPQPFVYLFQNFVDDYFKDYDQDGKRLLLKKRSTLNNQRATSDNTINSEYCEYKGWLEKNYYKFGLQLYRLRLSKGDTGQNKSTFKSGNPKTQLNKISNYEDGVGTIQSLKRYKGESLPLLVNQPFTNKPEFVRELLNDSNNKPFFSATKRVKYSINSQIGDKPSLLLINTIIPKINNSSELSSNFRGENIGRKETINSHDEFYIDRNVDESYSIKSIHLIKNTKLRSQIQKKHKKVSSQILKFRSTFLEMNTNLMIIFFLISMITIFLMYSISIINISEIDRDLMISYHCNQRLASLVEVDRRLRNVWLVKANLMSDKRLDFRNISSLSANSLKRAFEASQYLISNNSLITREIQFINDQFQNNFYSQSVTLYNIDKYGQNLQTYTETNSFIAGYQIYQMVNNVKKLPTQQITMNNTDLLFVLRNILNDIYIEYEKAEYILKNEITSSIYNIEESSLIILLIILIISIICLLLLIPGLIVLLNKKKCLLMHIVNINIQYCQSHIYRINQFMKGLQESYSDAEFFKLYEENQVIEANNDGKNSSSRQNKKINTNTKRIANTFEIKLHLTKFFLIFLTILTICIVIFYINKMIIATYMDSIDTASQRILFSSRMLAQQGFAMVIVYEYIGENGTTIVQNNPIELAIQETIPIISDLQGFLINFRNKKGDLDQSLEFLMIGNICEIIPPDSTKDCVTLGGGPGQNGISSINSFVYKSLSTALTEFQNSNRTTQNAYDTFNLWYLKYLETIFYRITTPTYSYLYNQLLNELNYQIESYKTFSLGWTLVSFFCLLITQMLIWMPTNHKLINETTNMSRIIEMIPKLIMEKSKFNRKG